MNEIICDFCGERSVATRYILYDLYLRMGDEFRMVRCNGCGLLYLNPQPSWEELLPYYQNRYKYYFEKKGSLISEWISHYGLLRRCQAILRYHHGGRLLDVGCGDGSFLKAMEHYGEWELYGVDPMLLTSVQNASKGSTLKIFHGTLLQINFPDHFFDVVTWWDVLEHVPNPSESLRETYRILKPGGHIFVQTPDPESWEARIFGPYWMGWDAPRHLYLFPPHVLVRRLGELNFIVEEVTRFAGGVPEIMRSLGNWLGSCGLERLQRLLITMEQSSAIRLIVSPFSLLMRRLGLVFSVLYVAKKPFNG